jgi:hypothetical protein
MTLAGQPTHKNFRSDFSEPLTLFACFLKSKISQKSTLAQQIASTLKDLTEFLKNSTENCYIDQLKIFDDSYKDYFLKTKGWALRKKSLENGKIKTPVVVGERQYTADQFLAEFERVKREKKSMGKGIESLAAKIVSSENLFMGNVKDSLRKLFIHEVSYIKNLEYDFNGIIADLEGYEADAGALG